MTVYTYTLGCKVNQYETQSIAEQFAAAGILPTQLPATADFIFINSCTVTAESDRKTRQALRRLRRINPTAVLILSGCMVQAFPQSAAALTEADLIFGNREIATIVPAALQYLKDKNRICSVLPHLPEDKYATPAIKNFSERTRAYMKIEDGCERYCTYCVIPRARGFVRSRSLADITAEAERLAANGFCEIVLVGINLTAYGKGEAFDLADAVDAVCRVNGICRVRLGSLEPDHMTDDLLKRLAGQKKFCPQFHLSLQSGCDCTLTRMNRHYDTAFYRNLIRRIRAAFPNAGITTDVMVGFAGETDAEFAESLEFVREIGFAKTHIFMYSRRAGTVAAQLPGQISNTVKAERSRRMAAVSAEAEREFLSSLCGQTLPVLIESVKDGFAEGYTPSYAKVKIPADGGPLHTVRQVLLLQAADTYCIGKWND